MSPLKAPSLPCCFFFFFFSVFLVCISRIYTAWRLTEASRKMITAVALAKHFTLPCVLEQDFSDCGTVCYPFICVSACALSVFTCCTRALLRIPAIHFRIWPFYGGQLACPKVLGAITFMIITVYALTLVSVHSLGDSPGFICLISPVPSQQH